jgi:molybdenum cofactor cytidylyltransferase
VAARVAQGAVIAAPVYKEQRGHPVCFSAALRDELAALRGDEGARGVIQRHRGAANLVEVDDPGVLRDIDVPGDIAGP